MLYRKVTCGGPHSNDQSVIYIKERKWNWIDNTMFKLHAAKERESIRSRDIASRERLGKVR